MIALKVNMVTTQILLFSYTDSLMYENKAEDFSKDKEMFDCINYFQLSQNIIMIQTN